MSESTKKRVSDADYVTAYVSCKSCEELSVATGLSAATCASRATKLRKAGVSLAKYQRKATAKVVDVDALNAIVAGQ